MQYLNNYDLVTIKRKTGKIFRLVRVILNCITIVIKYLINVCVMYQTLPIICPMCCLYKHSLMIMISFCIFISSGFCWKNTIFNPFYTRSLVFCASVCSLQLIGLDTSIYCFFFSMAKTLYFPLQIQLQLFHIIYQVLKMHQTIRIYIIKSLPSSQTGTGEKSSFVRRSIVTMQAFCVFR